jgi:hypothetical protein
MDEYTLTLAREYVQLVNARSSEHEEWRAIDSQRQVAHNELCRILRIAKTEDMYRVCRNLIHQARSEGDYEYDESD